MIRDSQADDILFSLTGVGVVQTDVQTGQFRRANEAFCGMLGYSEVELLTLTFCALCHPEDRARDEATFAALQRGEVRQGQCLTRCLRKDRQVVWLELSSMLLGEAGETVNLTFVKDVTETQRSASHLAFLAELGRDLEALTSIEDSMTRLGEKIGAHFNLTRCVFAETSESGDEVTLAYEWRRPEMPSTLGTYRMADYVTEAWEPHIRTGKTMVVGDALGDPRLESERLAALNIAAYVAVPLLRDGHWRYMLILHDARPRDWQDDEVTLMEELTGRIWTRLERARAEAARMASEEKYRTLFNSVDEALMVGEIILDEAGKPYDFRYLEVNPAYERITSHPEGTTVGKTLRQIMPQPDTAWIENVAKVAFGELPYLRKTSQTPGRWFSVSVSPVGQGGNGRFVSMFSEITEIKRAEAALRDSEAKYRTLFNAIDEGFCLIEKVAGDAGAPSDYRYLEVNPAFERHARLTGATGRTILELVPEAEASVMAIYDRVLQTGEPHRFEAFVAPLDLWMAAFAFRTGPPEKPLLGVIFSDISERKRAEDELKGLNETLEQRVAERTEALERSERRFAQAFQVGPVAACITTLGREVFLEVNDAFLALTGYDRSEIIGRSSRELSMWSSREDREKLAEAQRDELGFRNLELKLRDKAGQEHDLLLSAAVIRVNEEHGYLKMFYDITERKRTEAQLQRAVVEVMQDASWFSHQVMERFAHIRSGEGTKALVALSRRDRDVLERLAMGWDNRAIAEDLNLNIQTIRNYISVLYSKLEVHSRAEAVVWARERGITGH